MVTNTSIAKPALLRRLAGLAACLLLIGLANGCASFAKVVDITKPNDLRQQVARTDQPILVMYHKFTCPTSVAMEPVMEQLAADYTGRIVVARYLLVYPWFQLNDLDIAREYDVLFTPTVVLYVNGRERKRWFSDYLIWSYRKELDTVLGEPPPARGATASVRP